MRSQPNCWKRSNTWLLFQCYCLNNSNSYELYFSQCEVGIERLPYWVGLLRSSDEIVYVEEAWEVIVMCHGKVLPGLWNYPGVTDHSEQVMIGHLHEEWDVHRLRNAPNLLSPILSDHQRPFLGLYLEFNIYKHSNVYPVLLVFLDHSHSPPFLFISAQDFRTLSSRSRNCIRLLWMPEREIDVG